MISTLTVKKQIFLSRSAPDRLLNSPRAKISHFKINLRIHQINRNEMLHLLKKNLLRTLKHSLLTAHFILSFMYINCAKQTISFVDDYKFVEAINHIFVTYKVPYNWLYNEAKSLIFFLLFLLSTNFLIQYH